MPKVTYNIYNKQTGEIMSDLRLAQDGIVWRDSGEIYNESTPEPKENQDVYEIKFDA